MINFTPIAAQKVKDLLTVDGARRPPHTVYRKVKAVALKVLAHTGL